MQLPASPRGNGCGNAIDNVCGNAIDNVCGNAIDNVCGNAIDNVCGNARVNVCGNDRVKGCDNARVKGCGVARAKGCGNAMESGVDGVDVKAAANEWLTGYLRAEVMVVVATMVMNSGLGVIDGMFGVTKLAAPGGVSHVLEERFT